MQERRNQLFRIALLISLPLAMTVILALTFNITVGNAAHIKDDFPYEKLDSYGCEFSSHLPIIVIQTDVSSLYHGSRLAADMPSPGAIIWLFDSGDENRLTDIPAEVFNGATVNYRGYASLNYPKKGYNLKLYDYKSFFEPLDFGFFDLPAASEWILRTPYADKSLLRDWFSYELAASVLSWQPRGKMVQLFTQDGGSGMIEYQGVYFFCERITAGEARLNLGEFRIKTSERIDFDGGGYIYQRDRARPGSNYMVLSTLPDDQAFRLVHPSRGDMNSRQNDNLKKEITFIHEFLTRSGKYADIVDNDWDYWNYIDVESFIDYFLVSELTKNLDAGLVSTYMHRPVGGRFVMGPLWDGDWSMGNFQGICDPTLFHVIDRDMIRQLLDDKKFRNSFVERWQFLRSNKWSDDEILGLYDSMAEYLAVPAAQNAGRWPEKYEACHLEPRRPQPITTSWEEEIYVTREWLINRLNWLDAHIPGLLH